MQYQPRLDDIQFILNDVLDAPAGLQGLAPFSGIDTVLMQQILGEAGKFVAQAIAPLQRGGNAPRWRRGSAALRLRVLSEFGIRLQTIRSQCRSTPANRRATSGSLVGYIQKQAVALCPPALVAI